MNPITVKVAPKGEGKTKWLLEVAKKYQDESRPVYLFTTDEYTYVRFCNKYFATYSEACKVKIYEVTDSLENSIVLIDDVMHQGIDSNIIINMQKSCYKMFVTFEGICYDSDVQTGEVSTAELFEQLKLI